MPASPSAPQPAASGHAEAAVPLACHSRRSESRPRRRAQSGWRRPRHERPRQGGPIVCRMTTRVPGGGGARRSRRSGGHGRRGARERSSSDSFAIEGKRRFGSRHGPPEAAWMPIEACQPESITAQGRFLRRATAPPRRPSSPGRDPRRCGRRRCTSCCRRRRRAAGRPVVEDGAEGPGRGEGRLAVAALAGDDGRRLEHAAAQFDAAPAAADVEPEAHALGVHLPVGERGRPVRTP